MNWQRVYIIKVNAVEYIRTVARQGVDNLAEPSRL